MNKKCPNCGFINFVTAECCRKCETALSADGAPQPVYGGQGAPQPVYGGQGAPQPVYGGQGAPQPVYGGQGAPQPVYGGQGAPVGAYPRPYQVTPPKSGSPILKIFLCLLGGLIVVSAITGGGVAWLKRNSSVAWREFRPAQGNYTVMMPTEPRANAPIVTPLPMGNMTNHIYTSAVMGQGSALYCVVTFPIGLDMTKKVTDEMLDEELNNILTENKATLISKKTLLLAGSQGLEFEFRPPNGNLSTKNSRGFGKVFFMQNQEYLLLMTASEDSALFSGKDKFLNPIAY